MGFLPISLLLPLSSSNKAVSHDDLTIIRRGGLYVRHNWIDSAMIQALRQDIHQLYPLFQPSGLSNRVKGDPNEFGAQDRLTLTLTTDLEPNDARTATEEKLQGLQHQLEQSLQVSLSFTEHYYSISPPGSRLPRHMDERHEETKGSHGWSEDTRRSISWLLYLNDPDWNHGGELRAFCRLSSHSSPSCGAHKGDLQVGWLCPDDSKKAYFEPVFWDAWIQSENEATPTQEDVFLKYRPLSALYILQNEEQQYITEPFGPGTSSSWKTAGLDPLDFATTRASFIQPTSLSKRFIGVEDIASVEPLEVRPSGGTLVLFDSVTVPHQVLETTTGGGSRLAMAGWFHEQCQEYPDWFGT